MTPKATISPSVLREPIRALEGRRSADETARSVRGMTSLDAFGEFVARVRAEVDVRLGPWLDARVAQARSRGGDVEIVADAVRSLVMRGGKRMRAVLLAASYEACRGEGGSPAVTAAGAA